MSGPRIAGLLLLLLVAALIPLTVSADSSLPGRLRLFSETLDLDAAGAADVCWTIVVDQLPATGIELPFSYPWGEKLCARMVDGRELPVSFVTREAVDSIQLTFPTAVDRGETLEIRFRDPAHLIFSRAGPGAHGLYRWSTSFLNTTRLQIEEYRLTVLLPEGYRLFRVEKSEPAGGKKDPAPPYRIRNLGQRSELQLIARGLKAGSRCSLNYSFCARQRPWTLIGAWLLLVVVWLFVFRDLIDGPARDETGDQS